MSTPAIWCRIVHSRNVHPCHIVPICPLLHLPHPNFWPCRFVHSRKFHQPLRVSPSGLQEQSPWSGGYGTKWNIVILDNIVGLPLVRYCFSCFDVHFAFSYANAIFCSFVGLLPIRCSLKPCYGNYRVAAALVSVYCHTAPQKKKTNTSAILSTSRPTWREYVLGLAAIKIKYLIKIKPPKEEKSDIGQAEKRIVDTGQTGRDPTVTTNPGHNATGHNATVTKWHGQNDTGQNATAHGIGEELHKQLHVQLKLLMELYPDMLGWNNHYVSCCCENNCLITHKRRI